MPSFVSLFGHDGLPVPDCRTFFIEPATSATVPPGLTGLGSGPRLDDQYYVLQMKRWQVTLAPVAITVIPDCYVLPTGAVVTADGGIVVESLYPVLPAAYRMDANPADARAYQAILSGNAPAPRRLKQAIHCREIGEGGYFHWLTAALPRAALATRFMAGPDMPLLIEPWHSWGQAWLDLLFPGKPIVRTRGEALHVEALYFPAPAQVGDSHFTRHPRLVREFVAFVDAAMATQPAPTGALPERLYISRQDAPVRRLLNEDAVLAVLRSQGVTPVALAGLDIVEQYRLLRNASLVIGPHGAGLANIIFAPPEAALLEVFSVQRTWPSFRVLSRMVNVFYAPFVSDAYEPGQTATRGAGNEDFQVDPETLARFAATVVER